MGAMQKELNDRMLMDTRVCLMANVTAVDAEKNTVNVKPLILERKMAETEREVVYEEMAEIIDVPLATVNGIRFVPDPGDHGMLIFHDTDLDAYKLNRELLEVNTARFHDYNDAIFISLELSQINRPEPYAVLECGLFKINTNALIEKDVTINGNLCVMGDVIAGEDLASLVNLNAAYLEHSHPGPGLGPSRTDTSNEQECEECQF